MAFSQITTGDVDLLDRGIMKSERRGLTSDLALLKRLKAGQESAYRELLAAYGGRLLSVARRYMRNEEDSQDVLQDAFVQAFRKIHQFRGEASLGSWLHRIVVNSALMALRRGARKKEQAIEPLLPRFLEDGHQAKPAVPWPSDPEKLALKSEVRSTVRRAIDRLPGGYRTVLIMRDLEQLDTRETAETLELSENAVKIRLHRARQALRGLLDEHFRKEVA